MELDIIYYYAVIIAALAAGVSACGTLCIALISLMSAKAAERTAEEMKRASVAAGLDLINFSMGSKRDVMQLRDDLWNECVEEYENGNFFVIDKSCYQENRKAALDLSASFDRACCFMLVILRREQIYRMLDLFGDVFIKYWVICFNVIKDVIGSAGDDNIRLHYEFTVYLAYYYFLDQGREAKLQGYLEREGTIHRYMLQRLKEKETHPGLRKYYELLNEVGCDAIA